MDAPLFSSNDRLVTKATNSGDYVLKIRGTVSNPQGFMSDAEINSKDGVTTVRDYAQGGRTGSIDFDGEIVQFPDNKLSKTRVERVGIIPMWMAYATGLVLVAALAARIYN